MLRVSTPELFSNLWISDTPKTCEVLCNLYRPVRWREEMNNSWDPKAADAGCFEHAEEVLNASFKPR
jgi:hypothetical protein